MIKNSVNGHRRAATLIIDRTQNRSISIIEFIKRKLQDALISIITALEN